MTPSVRLVPMTPAAYARFVARIVPSYAADKAAAGNWLAEESLDKAAAEIRALLPDGPATAAHWLWSIEDESGREVGDLWAAKHPTLADALYIYDIEVAPEARGRGVGRAALEALDDWARNAGYGRIALHVFGVNDVARRLYARSGYVETNVIMEKRL